MHTYTDIYIIYTHNTHIHICISLSLSLSRGPCGHGHDAGRNDKTRHTV